MALFDILVIVLVVLAGIKGFQKGLVVELFSLLAFLVGLFLALKLTLPVAKEYFGDHDAFWLISLATFIILFFAVTWLARVVALSIKRVIDFTPAGIIDNVFGVVFCIVKWLFVLSTIMMVMNSLGLYIPSNWTKDSDLHAVVMRIGPVTIELVSAVIPWFNDVVDELELP